jgi:hypothetical protein
MTRALTQKSVASDLIFTGYVNAICNEGIRGLARFSAYLGLVYLLYGPFILRALYLAVSAWRNQRCASVRAPLCSWVVSTRTAFLFRLVYTMAVVA